MLTRTFEVYLGSQGSLTIFPEARVPLAEGGWAFNVTSIAQTNAGAVSVIWKEVSENLKEVTYHLSDTDIQIKLEWDRDLAKNVQREIESVLNIFLHGHIPKTRKELKQGIKPISVRCTVETSNNASDMYSEYYLKYFLSQLFLAMNLSAPGTCDLYKANIIWKGENSHWSVRPSVALIAGAYCESKKYDWPKIRSIDFLHVWQWLLKLQPIPQQFSQTRVERAIYALMHVCIDENVVNPTHLLWLAHALEALFDTPEVGISKALRDRVFLVLGVPTTHTQAFRKKINEFYELRSQFVHGGLAITHPLENEGYHEHSSVNDYMNRIQNSCEFAISIIIATLQVLVDRDWQNIKFSESFNGELI